MFKQTVLVLLALSVLNAEIWNERPRKYEMGKEYEYKYDAQVLTGLPTTSWQYTGYRLMATVRLLMKDVVTLKMENIQFLKLNEQINVDNGGMAFLPLDLFEKLNDNDEVKTLIQQQLTRPIVFEWKNGVVRNLQVSKQDTFWSINIKKGLLHMFNMNLKPKNKNEDRTVWNGNFHETQLEDGIEGICKSVYHWNHLPIRNIYENENENEMMNNAELSRDNVQITMTKTRNLRDCIEKPIFEHALFLSENCDEKRENVTNDIIKSQSTIHMNVTYWTNEKDFFLWSIKGNSEYTFAPMMEQLGLSISTFVKQNVTFIREMKESTLFNNDDDDDKNMRKEKNLQMIMPMTELLKDKQESELLRNRVFDVLNNIRTSIRPSSSSSSSTSDNSEFNKENVNDLLLRMIDELVQLLRQSPKSLIEKVHKECENGASDHPEVFDLFHDVLPTVATKEAVEIIIEKGILNVKSNVEDDLDVARRVQMLGFMNNVLYDDVIYNLIKVTKNPTLLKKTQRRETLKSLLLTIGTLTRTFTQQRRRVDDATDAATTTTADDDEMKKQNNLNMNKIDEIENDVIEFYREMMKTPVASMDKNEKMIIIIKALGNAALRKSFLILTDQFIYPQRENKDEEIYKVSTTHRIHAIYALKNFVPIMPLKVRQYLLPLLFDVRIDPEVRIASFIVLMRTKPTPIILDSIFDVIRRDPIQQVRSYLLSYMKSIVTTQDKCLTDIARNVSMLLQTSTDKNTQNGIQYSHTMSMPIITGDNFNSQLETNMIWSKDDFLPRDLHMKLMSELSGRNIQWMDLAIRTAGLQKLLKNLFGPNGNFYRMNNLQDLLKELNENEMNDINMDHEFSMNFKVFGQHMGYWALNENVKGLIQKGFIAISKEWMQFLTTPTSSSSNTKNKNHFQPLQWRRNSYLDAILRIPTTFGLPFTANFTSIIYAQINSQMKMLRPITDKEIIHFAVQINPILLSEHKVQVGIDATISKSFTQFKLQTHIPPSNNNNFNLHFVYHKQPKQQWRFFINKPKTTSSSTSSSSTTTSTTTTTANTLLQVKTTLRNVFMSVKSINKVDNEESSKSIEWIIDSKPIVAKLLPLKKSTEGKPMKKEFPLKSFGIKLTLTTLKSPIDNVVKMHNLPYPQPSFLFNADRLFQLDVENIGEKDEGLEVRITPKTTTTTTPDDVDSDDKKTNKYALNIQLLRSKMESLDDDSSRNKNPKFNLFYFFRDEKSALIEIEFGCDMNNKQSRHLVPFQIQIDLTNVLNKKYTINGQVKLPPSIHFDARNPLKIQFENNQQSFMEINAQLNDKNKKTIAKYRMTVDMDDVALGVFREMIENLQDYRALHPMVEQCYKDIKNKYTNTPACFFVWRYVNMFNRWNHTITLNDKTSENVRSMLDRSFVMKWFSLIQNSFGFVLPNTKRIIDESDNVNVYHSSFVASPFDLKVMQLNYIMDNLHVIFPMVPVSPYSITHMHATRRSVWTGIVRELTNGGYPATCKVRKVTNDRVQISTFDRVNYEGKLESPTPNVRYIWLQDVNNTIQASVFYKGDSKVIQIVAHGVKNIHIIRKLNVHEMTVLLDGQRVTTLPVVVKDDNDNVILQINQVSDNIYGIENLLYVEMPLIGFRLRTDVVQMTDIEVSPFFFGQLRGLCGDFNGETFTELKTRDCRGFVVYPEQIFQSPEYVLDDVKDLSENDSNVLQFVQRYHREHVKNPFIDLKTCRLERRLVPVVVKDKRPVY